MLQQVFSTVLIILLYCLTVKLLHRVRKAIRLSFPERNRKLKLFLMGYCPICEIHFFDAALYGNKKIHYWCPECKELDEEIERIIDGIV